jgi:hypothetical protein
VLARYLGLDPTRVEMRKLLMRGSYAGVGGFGRGLATLALALTVIVKVIKRTHILSPACTTFDGGGLFLLTMISNLK